jgi:dTDP-4-amino-4,6-dideoxygalactose transaminase
VADRIWKSIVTLPLYPELSFEQVDSIIALMEKFK